MRQYAAVVWEGGSSEYLATTINQVFDNPIYWRDVLESGAIAFFGSLLGVLWVILDYGTLDLVSILVNVGFFLIVFYYMAGRREIIGRPRRIEINSDGAVLHHRFWPSRKKVDWDEILSVNIYIGDLSTAAKLAQEEAHLWLGKKKYYPIKRDIGLAIREAYKARKGEYPPRGWPKT